MENHTAVLKKIKDISKGLSIFTFKINPKFDFKPGQWLTLAYQEGDNKILRPYSIASSPSQMPDIELFVRLINFKNKFGKFTSKLFKAKIGEKFGIIKIGGKFLLEEDKRKKIMISSGTGLAPYISMIRNQIENNSKCDFIVIHGVSYENDLSYREELEKYEKEEKIIKYIPAISRPEENKNWKGEVGRAEKLVISGRLSKILNESLDPKKYVFYLCGHPHMIEDINEYLKTIGFKEKEDIKFEKYWSSPRPKV